MCSGVDSLECALDDATEVGVFVGAIPVPSLNGLMRRWLLTAAIVPLVSGHLTL